MTRLQWLTIISCCLSELALGIQSRTSVQEVDQMPMVDGEMYINSPFHDNYKGKFLLRVQCCTPSAVAQVTKAIAEHQCTFVHHHRDTFDLNAAGGCDTAMVICSEVGANAIAATRVKGAVDAKIVHTDVSQLIAGDNTMVRKYKESDNIDFFTRFRDYDDIVWLLRQVASISSSVARLETLERRSSRGLSVHKVVFEGEGWTQGGDSIILTCQMHAREWIAGMACTKLVQLTAQKAVAEPDWLRNLQVVIVPLVNPDGFVHSYSEDRFWRKTRSGCKSDEAVCCGVDMNRNFDTDFGGPHSASLEVCSSTFIGPTARSEPESQNIADLFGSGVKAVIALDIHSYGCDVMGPWSYSDAKYERNVEARYLGDDMLQAMKAVAGSKYAYCSGLACSYLASGTFQDYTTAEGAIGYTIELPICEADGANGLEGFAPDASIIKSTGHELFEALKVAIAFNNKNVSMV